MPRDLTTLFCILVCCAGLLGCGSEPTQTSEPTLTADSPPEEVQTDQPAEDDGEEESDDEETAEVQITSLPQLAEALIAKNPGFDGQKMGMEPISAELLVVGINDPAVKDISPLRKQRIAKLDLQFCDITDLSPLKDMPIDTLYLEENHHLRDISALRGMPLQELRLGNTDVENIGALRGAPLVSFNGISTRISDLSPLEGSPLQMAWFTDCPVRDISPLAKSPLVSLTLENTPVEDISPLAGNPIQRLHIGGTNVTDLTPVAKMRLSRLIFTPSRIEKGLDVVRKLPISELGTNFDNRMPPAQFWAMYDAGELE